MQGTRHYETINQRSMQLYDDIMWKIQPKNEKKCVQKLISMAEFYGYEEECLPTPQMESKLIRYRIQQRKDMEMCTRIWM